MTKVFQYLVYIYLEPLESKYFTSIPTFLGHYALKISKEEPTLPFASSPLPFLSLNKVVLCIDVETRNLENQFIDPHTPSSFPPHGKYLI